MAATALGLPKPVKPKAGKNARKPGKIGKKGDPFRRIIKQESKTLIIQTGIRWIHGEPHPIMRPVRVHRFYHATKGWREFHDIVPRVHRGRAA